VNHLVIIASLAAIWAGSVAAYQVALLVLLARPMAAFLFVLQKLEAS
jgi:hypothetical protein